MKKNIKKEKLVKDIFKWIVAEVVVDKAKEKLLKIVIEATLDYLGINKLLKEEKNA